MWPLDTTVSLLKPMKTRLATFTLKDVKDKSPDLNTGILKAYQTGLIIVKEVGVQFGCTIRE